MNNEYNRILKCADYVKSKVEFDGKIGLILGSGLGNYVDRIDVKNILDYKDIPEFPTSTVEGHKGRFIFGNINNTEVAVMQGRVHYYEGYTMPDVVLPVRIMGLLGVKHIIITNAAGGIREFFKMGDFMAIRDHISSFVPSPLIGKNIDEFGQRFPDMTNIYDKKVLEFLTVTKKLKQGVYLQTTGPNYESPSEIKMYKILGADAVGMSTCCEAIAAKHMGMKVSGISLITNMAAGIQGTPLTHAEVKESAQKASVKFIEIITDTIEFIKDNL